MFLKKIEAITHEQAKQAVSQLESAEDVAHLLKLVTAFVEGKKSQHQGVAKAISNLKQAQNYLLQDEF